MVEAKGKKRWETALEGYRMVHGDDTFVYNAKIERFSAEGRFHEVNQCLSGMEKRFVPTSENTFTPILKEAARQGSVDVLQQIVHEVHDRFGMSLTTSMLSSFLEGLQHNPARRSEALAVILPLFVLKMAPACFSEAVGRLDADEWAAEVVDAATQIAKKEKLYSFVCHGSFLNTVYEKRGVQSVVDTLQGIQLGRITSEKGQWRPLIDGMPTSDRKLLTDKLVAAFSHAEEDLKACVLLLLYPDPNEMLDLLSCVMEKHGAHIQLDSYAMEAQSDGSVVYSKNVSNRGKRQNTHGKETLSVLPLLRQGDEAVSQNDVEKAMGVLQSLEALPLTEKKPYIRTHKLVNSIARLFLKHDNIDHVRSVLRFMTAHSFEVAEETIIGLARYLSDTMEHQSGGLEKDEIAKQLHHRMVHYFALPNSHSLYTGMVKFWTSAGKMDCVIDTVSDVVKCMEQGTMTAPLYSCNVYLWASTDKSHRALFDRILRVVHDHELDLNCTSYAALIVALTNAGEYSRCDQVLAVLETEGKMTDQLRQAAVTSYIYRGSFHSACSTLLHIKANGTLKESMYQLIDAIDKKECALDDILSGMKTLQDGSVHLAASTVMKVASNYRFKPKQVAVLGNIVRMYPSKVKRVVFSTLLRRAFSKSLLHAGAFAALQQEVLKHSQVTLTVPFLAHCTSKVNPERMNASLKEAIGCLPHERPLFITSGLDHLKRYWTRLANPVQALEDLVSVLGISKEELGVYTARQRRLVPFEDAAKFIVPHLDTIHSSLLH